jgi:hypothetical protein
VGALLDNSVFTTHGQPISGEDATDPKVGLTVDYVPPSDAFWQLAWQLYCLQVLAVKDRQKLFADVVSLCIDCRVV